MLRFIQKELKHFYQEGCYKFTRKWRNQLLNPPDSNIGQPSYNYLQAHEMEYFTGGTGPAPEIINKHDK